METREPVAWLHVLDNTEGLEENKPNRKVFLCLTENMGAF